MTSAGQTGNSLPFRYDTPDPVSRLTGLSNELAGTANDLTLGFSYNPAGQIAGNTRSNDAFAWTGSAAGTTGWEHNGLNQIGKQDGVNFSYDAKGREPPHEQRAHQPLLRPARPAGAPDRQPHRPALQRRRVHRGIGLPWRPDAAPLRPRPGRRRASGLVRRRRHRRPPLPPRRRTRQHRGGERCERQRHRHQQI
jgi:hypothetical protein